MNSHKKQNVIISFFYKYSYKSLVLVKIVEENNIIRKLLGCPLSCFLGMQVGNLKNGVVHHCFDVLYNPFYLRVF